MQINLVHKAPIGDRSLSRYVKLVALLLRTVHWISDIELDAVEVVDTRRPEAGMEGGGRPLRGGNGDDLRREAAPGKRRRVRRKKDCTVVRGSRQSRLR